jgi:hypothetical protein
MKEGRKEGRKEPPVAFQPKYAPEGSTLECQGRKEGRIPRKEGRI